RYLFLSFISLSVSLSLSLSFSIPLTVVYSPLNMAEPFLNTEKFKRVYIPLDEFPLASTTNADLIRFNHKYGRVFGIELSHASFQTLTQTFTPRVGTEECWGAPG